MEQSLQIEYRMKSAKDFQAQGKLLHAMQIYTSIINEHPEYTDVYISYAELCEFIGRIDPAISLINKVLVSNPQSKDIRLFLGQFLLRNSRWLEAVETLELLDFEEEPAIAFFLGYSHFMIKDFEKARINFINFINLESQTELLHEAHIYLAKIEIEFKDFESALFYAQKATVIYSNFWELNLIFAVIYYNLNMFEHASTFVEKAIKLKPDEPSCYEWAGKIYFKIGEYQKAEEKFHKFVELIEDVSSDVYTLLAEACLKRENLKEALAYFDIALKIDPENKQAQNGKTSAARSLKELTINE